MPRDRLFVQEAITASERIVTLAAGETAETLAADANTRDALLWNFTVLGEAIGKFALKDEFPEVEWHKPVALRNRIVHGYWSADLDILIDAAQRSVPDLLNQLTGILVKLPR